MIKQFYITGDSLTFGTELEDDHNYTDFKKNNSYGKKICDYLNLSDYTNTSMPGGSNERCYRLILQDITNLLKIYDPKEIFVMVGFSDASRREFCRINESYYNFMISHAPPNFGCLDGYGDFKLWQNLTDYFCNENGLIVYNTMIILAIQNFLKEKRIPYLLTNNLTPFYDKNLVSNFDLKRYYNNDSFFIFSQNNNYSIGKGLHPLLDAHNAWGNHLIEIIKEKNLTQQD